MNILLKFAKWRGSHRFGFQLEATCHPQTSNWVHSAQNDPANGSKMSCCSKHSVEKRIKTLKRNNYNSISSTCKYHMVALPQVISNRRYTIGQRRHVFHPRCAGVGQSARETPTFLGEAGEVAMRVPPWRPNSANPAIKPPTSTNKPHQVNKIWPWTKVACIPTPYCSQHCWGMLRLYPTDRWWE